MVSICRVDRNLTVFPNQTRYGTCGLACPANSDHVYKYLRYAYVHVQI